MILTVLKVIGIVLLVILGLFIFIMGILLFVPIRYQFAGNFYSELKADVKVNWAPVLLKATVSCRGKKVEYVVRLLGGVVMTNTNAKLSWIGRKFFSFDESAEQTEKDFEEFKEADAGNAMDGRENTRKADARESIGKIRKADERESIGKIRKADTKKNTRKESLTQRMQKKIKKIKKRICVLFDRLKQINKKKEKLLKLYHSKRFELAKTDALSYIKRLLSIIKPEELEGHIHFGMEDPATTGEILGVAAIALPLYDGFLTVQPDFEQACMEGTLKGKGKIRLFPVVKLVLKVIFNKNLIKVTKKAQTIIEA